MLDVRVLITGGLGFIGSNLARRLVDLGAQVTLVDSLIPDYGGNLFNIAGYEDRLRVNVADVRDPYSMAALVKGQDVLFNLAGQVSHLDSMQDPFTDLEINARSQLSILEACRHENPECKIVYAGTRQQYGKPQYLPLDEAHIQAPTDVNGVNKMAGEWYHIVYHNAYDLRTTSLRMTNTYGPRQLIKHNRQGFIIELGERGVRGLAFHSVGDEGFQGRMLEVGVFFELGIEGRDGDGTVVTRVHAGFSRKRSGQSLQRLVHDLRISTNEVATAAALDEEGIAGDDGVTDTIGRRAWRVPRGVHHRNLEMIPDPQDIARALAL